MNSSKILVLIGYPSQHRIHAMTLRNCILVILIGLKLCAIIDTTKNTGDIIVGERAEKHLKEWAREIATVMGETASNCSCPPDSPKDKAHLFCGYEMKRKSSSANPCEDQAIYRCMDPHPWKGIQQKDCAKLKDDNGKSLPIHKCGPVLSGKAPTARLCFPIK
jgi:hypothetical protein